jgi:membrane associated rhomboid family serine protease
MVMPIRDIQERHSFPIVTIVLIIINFIVFFYELQLGPRLDGFLKSAAFVPVDYFEPGNVAADAKSVLLSMFLHGGWMHILGNMLYLWIFGDNVEDRLGKLKYIFFYLACGWIATLSHGYLNRASAIPAVGASGAIAGVLGAYMVMFPKARVLTVVPLGLYMSMRELPALVVLGLWFGLQFLTGVASLGGVNESGGVAVWAHIGGFVAGIILAKVLARGPAPSRPGYAT